MKERFQKQVSPGSAALLILIVLVAVQYVWWRGLVYRPPTKGNIGAPGKMSTLGLSVTLEGRKDVTVETYAGDTEPGDADGQGYVARFDRPTGLALDSQGNLYVADTGNHRIRKVAVGGETTTLAGSEPGFADGPAPQAKFNAPCGICVAPDGAVYVGDTGNHCIRRILNGQVTTVFGKPPTGGASSGNTSGTLSLPGSVAYVPDVAKPYLLVADSGTKKIERFNLDRSAANEQSLPGPPTFIVGAPRQAIAIPQEGTLILAGQTFRNIQVEGGIIKPGTNLFEPSLRHPVSAWPYGDAWLVTDCDHGAIFLVRKGSATVLAGFSSSVGPIRGAKDNDGSRASFSTMSGIVSDAKRYVYVADTANNMIRRLTIPENILQQ